MRHRASSYAALFLAAIAWVVPAAQTAANELAFECDFDGPATKWQLLPGEVPSEVLEQECVREGVRENSGSERVVVSAPPAQSAMLLCPATPVAVLDDLKCSLWMKASRPDALLAVRIVLPRARNIDGQVTSVLVRGARYTRAEQWQQLTLADVPRLLAAEVRVLRTTSQKSIDPREAFVDAVVLVVPGGPKAIELQTDELQIDGVLLASRDDVRLTGYEGDSSPSPLWGGARGGANSPRLNGSLLLVENRPFCPRIIDYQGEPLAFLAERGFNAVHLAAPPTAEQVAEAGRHHLWFVVTPPRPEEIQRAGIGQAGDRIVAWYLPEDPAVSDPQYAQRWAAAIRENDAVPGRPVMMAPESDWAGASRTADIVLTNHPRLGLVPMAEYDGWLNSRPALVRPGTPLWAAVPTQFSSRVGKQVDALTGRPAPSQAIDAAQLDAVQRVLSAHLPRGIFFHSTSSLAAVDPATRYRALVLERMNHRLRMIEPWLAEGKVGGRVASSDPAWGGVVMHVGHARLLLPIAEQSSQAASAEHARTNVARADTSYTLPGIPESSQAYLLTPVALRTLGKQRVAGGTKISVPEIEDALVLITEDPRALQSLRQQILRDGPRYARLIREMTAARAALVAEEGRRLQQFGYRSEAAEQAIAALNQQLPQIDSQLASAQIESATKLATSLHDAIAKADAQRSVLVTRPIGIFSSPLLLGSQEIASHLAFERSLATARPGENLLYAGDFEQVGELSQSGWQQFRHGVSGINANVALSSSNPKHGQFCLEMRAANTSSAQVNPQIASAPTWIVSPPVAVQAGQVIEISGWVFVESPPSHDGLAIVDTLGGPELSLAVRQTSGWQPFRMIRAATEPGEVRITFALAGIGSARIDAVMVRTLDHPTARRLPSVQGPVVR